MREGIGLGHNGIAEPLVCRPFDPSLPATSRTGGDPVLSLGCTKQVGRHQGCQVHNSSRAFPLLGDTLEADGTPSHGRLSEQPTIRQTRCAPFARSTVPILTTTLGQWMSVCTTRVEQDNVSTTRILAVRRCRDEPLQNKPSAWTLVI